MTSTNGLQTLPSTAEILIVGAGFSGMGAAIKLLEAGRDDFVVIDRGHDVGGTWRDNTYPGAACDVPSHMYSYSFAPNPKWSKSFSPQPEIYAYMRETAAKHNVYDKTVFSTEFEGAQWNGSKWEVQTSKGTITARFVISGIGGLCEPSLPDIKGIDKYEASGGAIFHSAKWDDSIDLTGKRVAVIGTGASSIQIVPEVAKVVSHLDVYQRTAPWIIPRYDRPYPGLESWGYRHVPGLQRLARTAIYWGRESHLFAFSYNKVFNPVLKKAATEHIKRQVKDDVLRAKVTPDFQPGCKRMLLSNTWYPTLQQDHVELVTDGIREIRGNKIVANDGTAREIDVLIVATGFHVTDNPTWQTIRGADGASMSEVLGRAAGGAYKGISVHGFPNLFALTGPNTALGHNSMIFMIEAQLAYIMDALKQIEQRELATVEVRQAVAEKYNADIQAKLQNTVWNTGGCASWYLDEHGRNTTLWPDFTWVYRLQTRRFDINSYSTTALADLPDFEFTGSTK